MQKETFLRTNQIKYAKMVMQLLEKLMIISKRSIFFIVSNDNFAFVCFPF